MLTKTKIKNKLNKNQKGAKLTFAFLVGQKTKGKDKVKRKRKVFSSGKIFNFYSCKKRNETKKQPRQEKFVQEVGDYFENLSDFLDSSWGSVNLHKGAFRELQWLETSMALAKKVFNLSFKVSYRLLVASLIWALVYGLSPSVLSAPQSIEITLKNEWEAGTLDVIKTFGDNSSEDAIQLEAFGSWNARVWAPAPDTISVGHSSEIVGTDIYVFRGYSDTDFWRYDTTRNEWEVLDNTPFPTYYGADMAYDGSGSIYAIFGGFSKKFYKYDIEEKEWQQLPDLPDTVWSGAAIERSGEDFYVTRGGGSNDFWQFDVSAGEGGEWLSLAAVPYSVTTGGSLVNGNDGYLYLNCGGATNYRYYRYDIEGLDWEVKTSMPTNYGIAYEHKPTYYDGSLYYLGANYYSSAYHYFLLRYDISGESADTWFVLETPPASEAYSSLVFSEEDEIIYAFRSNGSFDLWKFDPNSGISGKWVGPEQVLDNAGTLNTGSDLIWNDGTAENNFVYATRGGNTSTFYQYDVTNNDWSQKADLPSSVNSRDMKGTYCNGYVYFLQGVSPYTDFYRYTPGSNTWETLSSQPFPATTSHGSGLTCAIDGSIYAIRGNGTASFYRYTEADGWQTNLPIMSVGGLNYYAYQGARIIAGGNDIYVMLGDGEKTFLKYSGGVWIKVASTPFAQYYGTDMTYDSSNGKIYALAGNYKNETWEYDVVADSWRRLPNNQKYSYERGPWSGASIEYAGGNSLFATTGQGFADLWSFTVGATDYPVSSILSGVYTSQVFDLGNVGDWLGFTATDDQPENTEIVYETRTGENILPDENWSEWAVVSGGKPVSPERRYIQTRITLSSSDGANTPTVYDYSVSYNSEEIVPQNPTVILGSSQQIGGEELISGEENLYVYTHPYFDWPEPETAGGASDPGSGIDGYYVYFGTASDADPENQGVYVSSSSYLVNEEISRGVYYLRIKTKDRQGNIQDEIWNAFIYNYNGVSPSISHQKTEEADFSLGQVDDMAISSGENALIIEAKSGFWNEFRLATAPGSISYGGEFAYSECSDGQECLYTFRGGNMNSFYEYNITNNVWTNKSNAYNNELVYYGGSLVEGPSGYIYGAKGINTNQFWRYDIENDLWETMASAPKMFYYGSSMAYDGERYIYAIPGNDDVLMRFDTQANNGFGQWTTALATAQFGNPNTSDGQRTYVGSDMVFDGRNNLYVSQGNYYPYFAKYSIGNDEEYGETANTWTMLALAPKGFMNGGSLGYDFENNFIYALRGDSRSDFFKYNVASNSWEEMPDAPASIGYGASLVAVSGKIYTLRGNWGSNLYCFDIEENSWKIPQRSFWGTTTFDGTSYLNYSYGTTMTDDGSGNIYIVRGYYNDLFGKYEIETGNFTELARLPMGAYNGASILYVDDEDAIYFSPGDLRSTDSYFYKYDISTNIWQEFAKPPGQIYRGSSMAYDGSRYIYLTQGGNGSVWWRYDTCQGQSACMPGWSGSLPTFSGWAQGYGSQLVYKEGIIYSARGENTNTFFACDVSLLPGECWSQKASLPSGKNIYNGGSLVDGQDGYLYATLAYNTDQFYRFSVADNQWEEVKSVPAQVYYGGSAVYEDNRIWLTSGGGTNSYQDGLYSYVIGSETNKTGFEKSGEYISEAIDLTAVYEWANLETKVELPDNTSMALSTRTSADGEAWSNWEQVNNPHEYSEDVYRYNLVSAPERYLQVKIMLFSSDQIFSPKVDYFKVNYYQDISAPQNPSTVFAYSHNGKTQIINSSSWYNYGTPHFEWPAADEVGGAYDNEGGSEVAGYYVYFGTEADGEPTVFYEENSFTASGLESGATYYLRIQAKDNASNIPMDIYDAFIYKYDTTVPSIPSDISVTPAGYTAIDSFVFLWTNDAIDSDSGILKYQYQTGGDEEVWYDIDDSETVTITLPSEEHIVGAYQQGKNTFYIRAVDNAGNVSLALSQDFYYSASAPSPPQNLLAVPEYSETNNFSFVWNQPDSFIGDPSKLRYYYSINAKPTAYNTVETSVKAVGPGPFATQKGPNTFYVVAKDEADNIDYELYSSVEFVADTSSPPVPGNVQAFDTSDREAQEYSVAIKWSTPDGIDAGNFAGYAIFRSDDNISFSEVAMTTGSAFVDTGLESRLYYYYVKSKDRTNNYSIASSTVSLTPTGRYTTPPTIVQEPSVSIQSFQATFSWATNRVCSSFIEYGKAISLGETTGQVDSVTDHLVEIKGLSADTKYFYQAKYIDQDGNIGTSDIGSFTTLPPPTISDFVISDIGLTAATVSYKTNTGGTCTLKHGQGSYDSTNEETNSSTSHVVKIEGLDNSTTYKTMTECIDSDGNEFSSDEYTFTTLRQPIVSEAQVENKENVDIPTVDVLYKTDEATTTLVKFKSTEEASYHNYLTNDSVLEHQATLEGLEPSKEYEVVLTGISATGVEAIPQTIKITTRSDSRPPGILVNRAIGKVIGRGEGAQANMYVKVETDELTNVKVFFGKGTVFDNFEQSSAEDPLNTYHLITIPVDAGQVYSYVIKAKDEAQNETVTKPITVVVEDSKENATEIVVNTFSNKFGWLSGLWKK